MNKTFFLFGSFFAFTGVALGAFGAHGLKNVVPPDLLAVFETAVRYQMYHAFALLVVSLSSKKFTSIVLHYSGWFFISGILFFSGSLYAMVFTGMRWFGAITPIGGVLFLLGWGVLFYSAFKMTTEN